LDGLHEETPKMPYPPLTPSPEEDRPQMRAPHEAAGRRRTLLRSSESFDRDACFVAPTTPQTHMKAVKGWGTPTILSPVPKSSHGTPAKAFLSEPEPPSPYSTVRRQLQMTKLRNYASAFEARRILSSLSLNEARRSLRAFRGWYHGHTHLTLTVLEEKGRLVASCGGGCERNLELALRCDVLCALDSSDFSLSDVQVTSIRPTTQQNTEVEFVISGMSSGTTADLRLERVATRLLAQVDATAGFLAQSTARKGSQDVFEFRLLATSQRYAPSVVTSQVGLSHVTRRVWVFPGQLFALAALLLATAGTVSAFLSSPLSRLPHQAPRRPGAAPSAPAMVLGEPVAVFDTLDPSTAMAVGALASSTLASALDKALEKAGVGDPRGGSSRVTYTDGTVRRKCDIPTVKAVTIRRARRLKGLLGEERLGDQLAVKTKLQTMIHTASEKVRDGYVYDEEAPVVSQVAKDLTSKMIESGFDMIGSLQPIEALIHALPQAAASAEPIQQIVTAAGHQVDSAAHALATLQSVV